jgi:hypothetical protein
MEVVFLGREIESHGVVAHRLNFGICLSFVIESQRFIHGQSLLISATPLYRYHLQLHTVPL